MNRPGVMLRNRFIGDASMPTSMSYAAGIQNEYSWRASKRAQAALRQMSAASCTLRRAGALTMRREPSSTTANSPIVSTAKNSKCGFMLEC